MVLVELKQDLKDVNMEMLLVDFMSVYLTGDVVAMDKLSRKLRKHHTSLNKQKKVILADIKKLAKTKPNEKS